jgi:hypothetical protein
MKPLLRYRAATESVKEIRREGLNPERVRVFAAPAGGPKWFVSVGFDRALMADGFLLRGAGRKLLVGSSAGAWRCLAMACKDPLSAYEKLRIAYSRNVFTEKDTPETVSLALKGNVEAFIGDDDIDHVLNHPRFDVAVHTVRAKSIAASANRRVEGAALILAAFLNAFSTRAMGLLYERVLFHTAADPHFGARFRGRTAPLTPRNLRNAALATGSLPYIVRGVDGIADAPPGLYRDGGLTDYQLNQDYAPEPGFTLFFHYQERIVPGWFDKRLPYRAPHPSCLARTLQVFPSDRFVKLLPDGRIPDRNDFITFAKNPDERIRRWDETAHTSEALGTEFLEDVRTGRIAERIETYER